MNLSAEEEMERLGQRLGKSLMARRIERQNSRKAVLLHQGEGLMRVERLVPIDDVIAAIIRAAGLSARGRANCLAVETDRVEWHLPRLPCAFEGLRILQISDLHIDLLPELAEIVHGIAASTPHDIAVITGDFRNFTDGDYAHAVKLCAGVFPALAGDRFGILGNHDFIEMVPGLEAAGMKMLLNECTTFRRGDAAIQIAGIDDSHFYRTHNLNMPARSREIFTLLLAHSPEIHAGIAAAGYDLVLCGHTHAGQICLPGGRHLVCPVRRLERGMIRGKWRSGDLQGYTSRGTGSCGVTARFNCPPEVTLHTLHQGGI